MQRAERIERVGHAPGPDQRHHRIAEQQAPAAAAARTARMRRAAARRPSRRASIADDQHQRAERVERAEPAQDARADAQGPRRDPTSATVAAPGRGYSSNARTSASSRSAIATANGASLALMNAWPTNSGQVASSASAMRPASGPPTRRPVRQTMTSPMQADDRAGQPARLEHAERQDLCEQRGREIEAAAVYVEIDPGQRAPVGEARGVERQQQVAVFGVGVVVPAEAVVAEGRERDEPRRSPARASARRSAMTGWSGLLRFRRRHRRSMPARVRQNKSGAQAPRLLSRRWTRWRRPNAGAYFIAASYIFATYSQFTR